MALVLIGSVVLALALVVVALAVMTGVGQRRRGGSRPVSVAAAVLFPLAWVAWYVADELPIGARRSGTAPQ